MGIYGVIYIGKKIVVKDFNELNKELAKLGYYCDSDMKVSTITGIPTDYEIHYSEDTDLEEGCIFGIEALASYVNTRTKVKSWEDKDEIQEVDLDILLNLLTKVRKDIPDAKIYLMDMHY